VDNPCPAKDTAFALCGQEVAVADRKRIRALELCTDGIPIIRNQIGEVLVNKGNHATADRHIDTVFHAQSKHLEKHRFHFIGGMSDMAFKH
jgi:hypothetical protein